MKISEILANSSKAYPSLEIVPPLRGMTKNELLESIAPFMEFSPKYINVTSHRDEFEFREEADGTFSRHLVRNRISETTVCAAIISKYDVEAVPHIICAGTTKEEIESKLDNLEFLGINNIGARSASLLPREATVTRANWSKAYADTREAPTIREGERWSRISPASRNTMTGFSASEWADTLKSTSRQRTSRPTS